MGDIPNDLIILISGASCVGKTTVAHYLLELISAFRNVIEMDIIRTAARSIVKDATNITPMIAENIYFRKYKALFASTKDGDYGVYKEQASFFVGSVREIVRRQQSRKIPTIIEGINIVPSLYFVDDMPIDGFQNHILFVNLYLSKESEHIRRRTLRCKERNYTDDSAMILNTVKKIRESKNELLHLECTRLSGQNDNVFSIDTADKTVEDVARQIMIFVKKAFTN